MAITKDKVIRVEWCENFIRHLFEQLAQNIGCGIHEAGIEVGCFWDKAEKSGLWKKGTYNAPMSYALKNLVTVEAVHNEEGRYCYTVFKMA